MNALREKNGKSKRDHSMKIMLRRSWHTCSCSSIAPAILQANHNSNAIVAAATAAGAQILAHVHAAFNDIRKTSDFH
jgi:hypothetical protein